MSKEASEDKALTPSGMKGIAEGIGNLLAESDTSPKEKKEVSAEGEKEPCVTCDEEKEQLKKEAPKTRFFIIDKETGREIPAVFKSGGKEYIPDSVDKLQTWTGLGIHANRELERIKDVEGFVKLLKKAQDEGRLIIKDESSSSPSDEEKAEGEKPEDEILTDPAVISLRKELKAVKNENKELKNKIDAWIQYQMKKTATDTRKEIEEEIKKFSKEYPLGEKRSQAVWRLLAEVDESDFPVHTVESAMKKIHEESLVEFREYLKEHPEFIEKDKIGKEAIVGYLKEKEEQEKHPVSSPSGVSAGAGPAKEEPQIRGVADIPVKIKELLASSKEAAGKV